MPIHRPCPNRWRSRVARSLPPSLSWHHGFTAATIGAVLTLWGMPLMPKNTGLLTSCCEPKLARAEHVSDLERAEVVRVSPRGVSLNGMPIAALDEVRRLRGTPDGRLREQLVALRGPGRPERVALEVNAEIDYGVVRAVLRECERAGYDRIGLLVDKVEYGW